jgi:hypothetical protein
MSDWSTEDGERRHRSLRHPNPSPEITETEPAVPGYAYETGTTDLGVEEPVVPESIRDDADGDR